MSVSNLQYIDNSTDQQGARKYTGTIALGYDQKRQQSDKWQIEQNIVENMLDDLQIGSWILDCPCGTGRFFEFYHRKKFCFRAIDASADMLRIASSKVIDPMKAKFAQGDVRATGLYDKSVDAAVNVRITRWLSPEDCQAMIREMQRVARKKIIFTARVADHPHARPIELFEQVLDGWKIARNERGSDDAYRIIMLKPEMAND